MMTGQFTFDFVTPGEIIALGVVLPVVCIIAVALRFFTRRTSNAGLKADDWLALCALLPTIGLGACLITGTCLKVLGYSIPAPPAKLSEEQFDYWLHAEKLKDIIEYTSLVLLMLSYGLVKISILFLYRRIFVIQKRSAVDIILMATVIVVALWALVFEILMIIACSEHFWVKRTSTGLKYSPARFMTQNGVVISDLVVDMVVFLIPIPLVWSLQMSLQRKFAVIGIFLLGASAVGASIVRLIIGVEIVQVEKTGIRIDELQAATLILYWCLLEAGLALVASCLPPMAYLFTHWREVRVPLSLRSRDFFHRSRGSRVGSDVVLKEDCFLPKPAIARTVSIDMTSEYHYCESADQIRQAVPDWYPDGTQRYR